MNFSPTMHLGIGPTTKIRIGHPTNKIKYKGAMYVLANQAIQPQTQLKLNRILKVLELYIPQKLVNALGFKKFWGQCSGIWKIKTSTLRALKRKKTDQSIIRDLVLILKYIQRAKNFGIKRFCFSKVWPVQTKENKCRQDSTREHEKFHALVWALEDKHRMVRGNPIGLMVNVVKQVQSKLSGYTGKTGDDAIEIILKRVPTELGLKEKWVSLIDINLWRIQNLIPKDVAAKYASGLGSTYFIEELLADLAGSEAVKGLDCRGDLSTYSEDGIERIVDSGLTVKTVVKQLLNVPAAVSIIVDFVRVRH